jgi:hypothetical protein
MVSDLEVDPQLATDLALLLDRFIAQITSTSQNTLSKP